ncbi:MAG: SDR family NAD(P)-dependent oxidoreductase [Planctomycetota bacterium]|jgi:short-subunit dehydrogenase
MGRIQTYAGLGCLVTGASAGIGREIARELARAQARVVVTARRQERLDELVEELRALGAPEAHAVLADLAQPAAPETLAAEAASRLGEVDVLVNNAGFSVPGSFARSDVEKTLQMIQVNVTASVLLMRRLLPEMLRRDRGGVLTVSSVAGFQAAPYQAGYAGTKAFLLNLSESVHQEVKHTGVAVTALCPGVTDTEFFDAAGYRNLGKLMDRRMPADRVARIGLKALRKGRMTVVCGARNKVSVFAERFFPRRVVAEVSRRLMAGRKRKTPRTREAS